MSEFLRILWFVAAFIDDSEYCSLWQLKQYRWDRVRDFFSTPQGRRYFFRLPPFLRFEFRRPAITPKAAAIIILSLLVEWSALTVFGGTLAVFLVATVLRPLIVSLFTSILYLPSRVIREWMIVGAKRKLARYPSLCVIGITGSYGKTSTKDFLAHILSKKYRVLKTPANFNNDYGIARTILDADVSKIDIFIVEMGAYRVGDIALYCRMVNPSIGILTGINEQHLSLFGSMQNIQKAKYTLLRSLPKNGLAITNSDNQYCREFLAELAAPVQTFGREEAYTPTCRILKAETTADRVAGLYALDTETIEIILPFPGVQYAENIAPCILVARHLGLALDEIGEACRTMPAPEQGRIIRYGNALVIDNSYNSNPTGFHASLELLKKIGEGRKKIVMTRGMMELGDASDAVHEKIGREIADAADALAVITPDFIIPLKKGFGDGILELYDPERAAEYLRGLRETSAALLIESRIPPAVRQELLHL